jgi:hypothetical protein
MEQRAEAEIKRRKRKEDDLRIAEQRIEQLEGTIKQLEELVEKNPKRALPARGANDSPESHSDKRSRAVDTHLSLEAMASSTPVTSAPEEIKISSSTPAKKDEIQMSSSTPAKKAEIQTSPSTPAEKADAQLITSLSEEETETDDDGSDESSSVASIPTWTPNIMDSTIFNADKGCVNQLKPNRDRLLCPLRECARIPTDCTPRRRWDASRWRPGEHGSGRFTNTYQTDATHKNSISRKSRSCKQHCRT